MIALLFILLIFQVTGRMLMIYIHSTWGLRSAPRIYNLNNENLKNGTTSSVKLYDFSGRWSYKLFDNCLTRLGAAYNYMYKYNLLAKRALPRWWATLGQAAFGKIIQGQLDLCESNLCASCHTKCGTYIWSQIEKMGDVQQLHLQIYFVRQGSMAWHFHYRSVAK